ncbi:MAG: sulfurtransferase-like selenium metabolism protein YedF [Clostridiales bacterium]|jgi:selenium metabolism protein YedF|nr:sulfurtransferase-like selenium metabolism protein YedF [Clostridiales bacterium]
MIKIDARGEDCPLPVIRARKALNGIEKDGAVRVSVDNKIAVQNLEKMSGVMGHKIEIKQVSDSHYDVLIIKGEGRLEEAAAENSGSGAVIVVSSDKMGEGSGELGRTLLKSYIFALSEQEIKPGKMIFYNSGVRLTTEGSDSVDDLKSLEASGVQIFSCGACLNYYGLTEKLLVGSATNMYDIISYTMGAASVLKP